MRRDPAAVDEEEESGAVVMLCCVLVCYVVDGRIGYFLILIKECCHLLSTLVCLERSKQGIRHKDSA